MNETDNRISIGLLVLALATAAALVLPGTASQPLGIDEHVSYWICGSENPGTLWQRSMDYAATPPLSSIFQRACIALGGKSVFCMRLTSILGFLAAIMFTFLFARELLGALPAGLAVQLLMWHPDLIDRMRQARPYGLTVALAACFLWLSILWCRSPRNLRLTLVWVIVAAALGWTHYLNLPLVGLVAVWLMGIPRCMIPGQQRCLSRLIPASAAVIIACLPLHSSLVRLQQWSDALSFRASRPPLWQGVGPYWWFTLPVGLCTGWLLTRLVRSRRLSVPCRETLPALVLLGALPILAFAVVPIDGLATLAEPRYRLVYAPASVILLASCLIQNRGLIPTLVASALGIAGAWWVLGERPWHSTELTVPAAADWTRLTTVLQEQGKPNEPVFVYSGLVESRLIPVLPRDVLFHDYVACRAGRFILETPHPRFALPWVWVSHPPLMTFYESALEATNEQSSSVWLIASTDTDLARSTVEKFGDFVANRGFREESRVEMDKAILVRFVSRR